jgi:cardiolipin synthase A/B
MSPTRLIASRPTAVVGLRRPFSTYQAMAQVIESSHASLYLVFFAVTETAAPLIGSVASRARDGVRVTFCLDDNTDALSTLADLWPADAPLPRVLVPNRVRWPEGNMHAKAIIADGRSALITSANLTGWATDQNLELGILVDEPTARELRDFIITLLRSRALVQIPIPVRS